MLHSKVFFLKKSLAGLICHFCFMGNFIYLLVPMLLMNQYLSNTLPRWNIPVVHPSRILVCMSTIQNFKITLANLNHKTEIRKVSFSRKYKLLSYSLQKWIHMHWMVMLRTSRLIQTSNVCFSELLWYTYNKHKADTNIYMSVTSKFPRIMLH